jgi:tripartite-type tricarboxylate transporter receptor subunit TctC
VPQSLLAGTTEIGSTALAAVHAQIKGGLVRALAIAGPERWFDLPDVPTLVELGHAGFISETFLSAYVPAGTPQPILDRLVQATIGVMGDAENRTRMRNAGFIVRPDGPAALAARVAREVPLWRDLIARAGILPE